MPYCLKRRTTFVQARCAALGVLLMCWPNNGRCGQELRALHAPGAAILRPSDGCGNMLVARADRNTAMGKGRPRFYAERQERQEKSGGDRVHTHG